MITVDINGSGDFTSVNEAVRSAAANERIFVKKGLYHERVEVTSPGISIVGEDAENTVIEYGLYGFMKTDEGVKLGTFRSYTMLVNTDDFFCKNITVRNSAGFGKDIGQAVYAEGDMIRFEGCRFLGRQDTLFTGPLPLREKEKGGFRGPTEFAERKQGRQFYLNCYIEGDVDFIFGSAAAYFENCEIRSLDRGEEINGYVTASSAYESSETGYIFRNCRFTGDCPAASVYLGRPWRNYAKTVLVNCEIGAHIRPEMFHDWNKEEARGTVFYALCGCFGEGYSPDSAAPFVKILPESEAEKYTEQTVTGIR